MPKRQTLNTCTFQSIYVTTSCCGNNRLHGCQTPSMATCSDIPFPWISMEKYAFSKIVRWMLKLVILGGSNDGLVVASIFWRKSIILGHQFLWDLWRLYPLWHLFSCGCFIAHDVDTFRLVLHFSAVLTFESIRPLINALPWFACACIDISVLFRYDHIYSTLIALGCWLESSSFYRPGRSYQLRSQNPKEDTFRVILRASSKVS